MAAEQQRGGCQCGAVRYVAPAQPLAVYVCHCSQCRGQSSSAFGISVTVPRADFAVTTGTPLLWDRPTAKGHTLTCAFCGQCGSRLWHQSSGFPQTLNIKGGSLDRPLDLSEAVHIWASNKLRGVLVPDGATVYAEEPVDVP